MELPLGKQSPRQAGKVHSAVSTQTHCDLFDIKIVPRHWSSLLAFSDSEKDEY